jgi:hypothetical protein
MTLKKESETLNLGQLFHNDTTQDKKKQTVQDSTNKKADFQYSVKLNFESLFWHHFLTSTA